MLQRAVFTTSAAAAARAGFTALLAGHPRLMRKVERFRDEMTTPEILTSSVQLIAELAPHLTDMTARQASQRFFEGLKPHLDRFSRLEPSNAMADKLAPKAAPGYGFAMTELGGQIVVMDVQSSSPAVAAGLVAGDVVTRVNGYPVSTVANLRALPPTNGRVEVTINRGGRDTVIAMQRTVVAPQPVTVERVDGTAVLRVRAFTLDAASLISSAPEAANVQDDEPLVVDLRDNGGGTDPQSSADLFAARGASFGGVQRLFGSPCVEGGQRELTAGGRWERLGPLLIMVNEGTASAAEAFARMLQASGRAVVVGPRSHGKATVQSVIPIPGGFDLVLSTALLVVDGSTWNETGLAMQHLTIPGLDTSLLNRAASSWAEYSQARRAAAAAVQHPDFMRQVVRH